MLEIEKVYNPKYVIDLDLDEDMFDEDMFDEDIFDEDILAEICLMKTY